MKRARIVQFGIAAQDPRSLAEFYRRVFGWESGSFQTHKSEVFVVQDIGGDVRARIAVPHLTEKVTSGFVCTVAVDSSAATRDLVIANGGKVIQEIPFIEGVGGSVTFEDPEGNLVNAMQFK